MLHSLIYSGLCWRSFHVINQKPCPVRISKCQTPKPHGKLLSCVWFGCWPKLLVRPCAKNLTAVTPFVLTDPSETERTPPFYRWAIRGLVWWSDLLKDHAARKWCSKGTRFPLCKVTKPQRPVLRNLWGGHLWESFYHINNKIIHTVVLWSSGTTIWTQVCQTHVFNHCTRLFLFLFLNVVQKGKKKSFCQHNIAQEKRCAIPDGAPTILPFPSNTGLLMRLSIEAEVSLTFFQ